MGPRVCTSAIEMAWKLGLADPLKGDSDARLEKKPSGELFAGSGKEFATAGAGSATIVPVVK